MTAEEINLDKNRVRECNRMLPTKSISMDGGALVQTIRAPFVNVTGIIRDRP